jgi:rRNA pseudouridine-1189 N-methylase Emg1 (Nep1/Mra1 family)
MDKEKLEFFKNLLEKQLADLLAEAGVTVKTMSDKGELFPDPLTALPLNQTVIFFFGYGTGKENSSEKFKRLWSG